MTDRAPERARPPDEPPDRPGAPPPTVVVVLAVLAVVSGVVARFAATSPLWLDEALSANISGLPVGELLDALRHDGHPPLYYLLLHYWQDLFGTSDGAVRALSGVFSVAILPLAWVAGRRRGGPTLAWLTLAVVAAAPFAIRYATETRMYALVMLLVLAGYLLIDDIARRGRGGPARVAGLALVAGALLYAHYWSMWLLAAAGLVLAGQAWRRRQAGATGWTPPMTALAAMAAGAVLFLPWVPTLLHQSANTGTPWAGPMRPTTVAAVTLVDFGGGGFRDAELVGLVLALLVVLALFGRALDRTHIVLDLHTEPQLRVEAVAVVLTMGIGTLVAYATWSAYASRYAAVVFPLFALLVAGGLSRFTGARWQGGALAVVLALGALSAGFQLTHARTQSAVIASATADVARPGDLVVYCPDQLGPAGSREMPGGLDQVVYPTFGPPDRVDWVGYAERNESADPDAFATQALARAGDHAIFVVWNGGYRTFEGQCEALVDALTLARPPGDLLVSQDGGYFENASLAWFPAP